MVRQCLELGLHRQQSVSHGDGYTNELGKRLFWSVYHLERKVAIVLGRPFAIHEAEIEADAPLEIDDDVQDEEALAKAHRVFRESSKADQKWWPSRTSNMSFHICLTLLDQINSKIRHTLCRIRRGNLSKQADKKLAKRFSELESWRLNVLGTFEWPCCRKAVIGLYVSLTACKVKRQCWLRPMRKVILKSTKD